MKASSMYLKFAKTAALAVSALLSLSVAIGLMSSAAQARPHFVQDVQYVQVAPQLVITPPQVVIRAPVYVAPVILPAHPPAYAPVSAPIYAPRYVRGHIYYINGRPYMNGYPHYRRHPHQRHHGHGHGHREDGRH